MLATMSGTASARSKRFYDASGKGIGTYSTDSQGTRTFYDSRGKVIGRESTSGNTTTVYVRRARHWQATVASPQKITFGEMREGGTREVLVYCRDHRCSHHVETNADGWPDDVRLSDIEPGFVCTRCGRRGAEVRPKFPDARMGNG